MRQVLSLLAVLCTAFILSACGSSQPAAPPPPAAISEAPDWFLRPPGDDNNLYAAKTSTSSDLQIAMNKAEQECRLSLSQQLETKMTGLIKKFDEETGSGENPNLLSQYTQVSKSVVNQEMNGTKPRDTKMIKDGSVYRAYVLMVIPLGEANKILIQKIKADEALRTELRASKAYQELEKETGEQ
ncbi:MAG: hypothetical protein IAF08_12960 [Rhizobacter sp.]|nr:hypothetical protein [Chlorobiales bacterium]